MQTTAKRRVRRRGSIAAEPSAEPSLPRRAPVFTLLAVGALLGAALMVTVRELAGGVESVARARDASDDTIASIESALRADDRALRNVDPLRLDWLTAHTVLEPAPDWTATRAALDEWEQAARSVTGLSIGKRVRVDEATTAAYWERILGALQQDAGVRFDLTPPRPENPADQFLSAGLATRRVSPATLPLLLAALGQRLQESVELVVAGERLLARATLLTGAQVTLDLDPSGLHTPDEKQLTASQHIPIKAVEAGSDLTPLTSRQLGAWLLARRARVLRYRGNFAGAERDLLLARQIFPVNRAMFLQLVQLLDRRGPHVLGDTAWDIYQSKERQRTALAGANRVPTTPEQVMQFNRMRNSEFGVRNEPFGIPSSIPHSAFRIPSSTGPQR